jgi:hypothetical protein
MAFDFLGTFTNEQLLELEAFIQVCLIETDLQANHLVMEANRYRKVKLKLETALKNLGALTDSDQLIFYRGERELSGNKFVKKTYTNNLFEHSFLRQDTGAPNMYDDFNVGQLVSKLKAPYINEIKFKRENLEKRIRHCSDYIEQCEEQRMMKIYAKTESLQLLKTIKEIVSIEESRVTSFDLSTTA